MWRSLASVLAWGARGRRFESSHPDFIQVNRSIAMHKKGEYFMSRWIFFFASLLILNNEIFPEQIAERTGETTTSFEEVREDCFHLGVKVLLCTNEHKVLLLKKQHSANGSYWDLPGGRLQKGETVVETLRRETEEETGFQSLDGLSPFDMIVTNIRIPINSGEVGLILSIYHSNINASFVPQLSSEHSGFGWFSFSEAAQLLAAQYPNTFLEKLTSLE